MNDTQANITIAEGVAMLFPGSTIRVKDVPSEFVPKNYEKDESDFVLKYSNGSKVLIYTLPF